MHHNNLIQELLEGIPFPVYVVDVTSHEIIFTNGAHLSLHGSTINKICYQALFGEDEPCFFCKIDTLIDDAAKPNGKSCTFEHFNEANDHWYQLQEKAIIWHDDRTAKYSIAVDISSLKETQNELVAAHAELMLKNKEISQVVEKVQQQNIQLSNLNEDKNRYIGMVAHDLRNPLGSVLNYAEIILEEMGEITINEQNEILNLIIMAANEMITMVNDTLDCTAIERGHLKLNMRESCLATLIKRRLHICHYRAEIKRIQISHQLEFTHTLIIDENRIAQVLDNLLVNAIKFSASNTEIKVKLQLKDCNSVMISIQDQGPGITHSEIDNIFGEFKTTSNKSTNCEKSVGLGLAIVKKIIDEHHGQITVESEVGKGTTFYILLPIKLEINSS